jgi:hypothetical protein
MSEAEILVEQIKLSTDFQTNKIILREKILTDLHLTYNGGLFKITPELIAFAATWPDANMFLEDVYQNPIELNRAEFLKQAQQHYQKVMNTWHCEHAELKKLRKL